MNGEEVAVFFMAASGFKRMTEIIGELAEKSSPFSKNLIFSGGNDQNLDTEHRAPLTIAMRALLRGSSSRKVPEPRGLAPGPNISPFQSHFTLSRIVAIGRFDSESRSVAKITRKFRVA